MKSYLLNAARAAVLLVAAMLATVWPEASPAQVVTQSPSYINNNSVLDLGNGPMELRTVLGNGWIFSSQSSGVGSTSGSSTALTLTGTPATPPCVGCILSGAGITSGTTAISFNGTTTVGMSAAMTVAAGTAVAWGAACPSYVSLGGLAPAPNVPLQVGGAASDLPLYTQARICGLSNNGPGATILPFAIGAH